MTRLLRAECQKLLTLPVVWVTMLLILGTGPLVARVQRGWLVGESRLGVLRTVPDYLVLPVLAFGVVAVCSEYGSSQIVTSLLAAPHRGRLLTTKVLVIGALAGFMAAVALAAGRFALGTELWTASEMGFVAVGASVLACLAVIAAGLSLAVRHLVGSIVGVLGVILVAPVVFASWPRVTTWLPAALGRELYGGAVRVLEAPRAEVGLGCWVAGALALGAVRFLATDA